MIEATTADGKQPIILKSSMSFYEHRMIEDPLRQLLGQSFVCHAGANDSLALD